MTKKTVKDIDVGGKKVLLRVDFNVPYYINTCVISDDNRIKSALPTIKYLLDHKAKVILCSHLGRPEGKVVEELRMSQIAQRLSQFIGLPVSTLPDCIGPKVEHKVAKLKEGDILLLENVRFNPGEEKNDPEFALNLARLADIYVDDAFGTAHRMHASTTGVAKHLPAVAGFLMEKELEAMGSLLDNPVHPFACLIGGAKVSDKITLVRNMLKKVDKLLIGGGMAASFIRAKGYNTGLSYIEANLNLARELLEEAKRHNVTLFLPVDVVVAEEISENASTKTVSITEVPPNSHIVDIGPQSIQLFCNALRNCHTIIWNGPMGIYEINQFTQGTRTIASFLATLNANVVIGGGSTAEIVQEMGLTDKMTHVSTGGGATLRFLEGYTLPGVDVLMEK